MIKEAIAKVVNRVDLSSDEAYQVMNEIMGGVATDAQIAAFITALRMKGETVSEITEFARVMREKASTIKIDVEDEMVVDTCGTGGDGACTFNISTTAAFVVAGAGVKVAKHGNRSVSSKCGSADLLEALGITINLAPFQVEECINKIGIGFMFAPSFHGAMKHAIGPRREIGIRTVFNILGPLTNPAGAQAQVLGVYDPHLTETMAEVLGNLGSTQAFVVHGHGGLDEVSITGTTKVTQLKNGQVSTFNLDPIQYGLKLATSQDISGYSTEENAEITRKILAGETGPRRDIVLLNTALALVAGQKAEDIKAGIKMAEESIDSGKALSKLNELVDYTRGCV